jgi:hypothetical protein
MIKKLPSIPLEWQKGRDKVIPTFFFISLIWEIVMVKN